jgi:hypothetical protein
MRADHIPQAPACLTPHAADASGPSGDAQAGRAGSGHTGMLDGAATAATGASRHGGVPPAGRGGGRHAVGRLSQLRYADGRTLSIPNDRYKKATGASNVQKYEKGSFER